MALLRGIYHNIDMQKNNRGIAALLSIYFLMCLVTLLSWKYNQQYQLTGDEPHYLVMADGIAKHGTFEQTLPYQDEFQNKRFYPQGLVGSASADADVLGDARRGPHGMFNVHNVGLPLLLALPLLVGGILGTKLFLILISGLIVGVAWKASGEFSDAEGARFWTVAALCLSLPFIPAANQIYPEILAAVICLFGLYWLLTVQRKRAAWQESLYAGSLAFLPWLQIKFTVSAIIMVLALAWCLRSVKGDWRSMARILLPLAFSGMLLAFYNDYAFGKFSGPYQPNALVLNKHSIMVSLGLYLDQNHGFLMQNPLFFLGLFSLPGLFKQNWRFALVWLLVFLSLIVPNGLHHGWYGGNSLSGRFSLVAASVFIFPSLFGMLRLAASNGRAFRALTGLGLCLQALFFYQYAFVVADLYNRSNLVPLPALSAYSTVYSMLRNYLPAMYNPEWGYWYGPNFAWLIVAMGILIFGCLHSIGKLPGSKKMLLSYGAVFAVIVIAGSAMRMSTTDEEVFAGQRVNYAIEKSIVGMVVVDQTGAQKARMIGNTKRLKFADKSLSLDGDGNAGKLCRLLWAAHGRRPDVATLGRYLASIASGLSLTQIADDVAATPEFAARYRSADERQFASMLFTNIFHRAPDPKGLPWYVDRLENHTANRGQILLEFSELPEFVSARAASLAHGVEYLPGKPIMRPKQFDPAFARVPSSKTWAACWLPTLVGKAKRPCLLEGGKDSGILSFGPFVGLPAGQYAFELHYSTDLDSPLVLGKWDVQGSSEGNVRMHSQGQLPGTGGVGKVLRGEFGVDAASVGEVIEVRTASNGSGRIVIERLVISRINAVVAVSNPPILAFPVGVSGGAPEVGDFAVIPSGKSWRACELPTLIGKTGQGCLLESNKTAGVLSYGPYVALPTGHYGFEMKYKSLNAATQVLGSWDVHIGLPDDAKTLSQGDVTGTAGAWKIIQGEFEVTAPYSHEKIEIRSHANGTGGVSLESLAIRRID